jgi:hypothetical protein
MGDFSYIVRDCYILTAQPGKHRQVPGRSEIRTQKSFAANLQLDSEQCVLNYDTRGGHSVLEMIRASAELENTFAINSRQPRFTKLLLNLLREIFDRHFVYLSNLWISCFVNNWESILVCKALITRPGKIPR